MKQLYPTAQQANLMFLLISAAILFGSGLLAPKLGLGINLWINEYIWILAPSILLVKLGKMPVQEVFKLKKTSRKNLLVAILASISLWFFSSYLSKVTGMFLNSKFGSLDTGSVMDHLTANQSILILLGMLFLAPVCEELLFRGVIQSAYEAHKKNTAS